MLSKPLKEEKGIALVTTLMYMVLAFALVMTLMLLVTQGTRLSGVEQRYTTSLEAAKGGTDFLINMIRNNVYAAPNNIITSAATPSGSCLQTKMTDVTPNWTLDPNCGANASTLSPTDNPDITMALAGNQVWIKIVDTRMTPEDTTATPPIPAYAFYTVNVRAQDPARNEHVEISFLYRMEN